MDKYRVMLDFYARSDEVAKYKMDAALSMLGADNVPAPGVISLQRAVKVEVREWETLDLSSVVD